MSNILIEELSAALAAPFAPEQVHQLDKGGVLLDYVGHAEVTERLNQVDPSWYWKPFATAPDGGPLIRFNDNTAELWIVLVVGGVSRPAVGTAKATAYSGEVAKELISDAIRNGAMRFGVALDLWKKHDNVAAPQHAPTSTQSRPLPAAPARPAGVISDPNAAVPLTDGQSKNLYRLWHHKLNYDKVQYLDAILIASGLEVTDDRQLSKQDAAKVISYLKEQAGEEDSGWNPSPAQDAPPPDDSFFGDSHESIGGDFLSEPF